MLFLIKWLIIANISLACQLGVFISSRVGRVCINEIVASK